MALPVYTKSEVDRVRKLICDTFSVCIGRCEYIPLSHRDKYNILRQREDHLASPAITAVEKSCFKYREGSYPNLTVSKPTFSFLHLCTNYIYAIHYTELNLYHKAEHVVTSLPPGLVATVESELKFMLDETSDEEYLKAFDFERQLSTDEVFPSSSGCEDPIDDDDEGFSIWMSETSDVVYLKNDGVIYCEFSIMQIVRSWYIVQLEQNLLHADVHELVPTEILTEEPENEVSSQLGFPSVHVVEEIAILPIAEITNIKTYESMVCIETDKFRIVPMERRTCDLTAIENRSDGTTSSLCRQLKKYCTEDRSGMVNGSKKLVAINTFLNPTITDLVTRPIKRFFLAVSSWIQLIEESESTIKRRIVPEERPERLGRGYEYSFQPP